MNKLDNTIRLVNVFGIAESIKASGYPMKSELEDGSYITNKDFKRGNILGTSKPGSGHDCYLKGIIVQADWEIPQYIWMQVERYHFLDIISSQSKMHRLTRMDIKKQCNEYVDDRVIEILQEYIDEYNSTDEKEDKKKQTVFQRIVSNTPMGLKLTARITTNYLQLKTIYNQRKCHKLLEWKVICEWIESLPLFKELVLGEGQV